MSLPKSREEDCCHNDFLTRWPPQFVIVIAAMVSLICASSEAFAELRELKAVSLAPHGARWMIFNRIRTSEKSVIEVSAQGDLLVLSSTPHGNMELSRIRNWHEAIPDISHLQLPAPFRHNDRRKLHGVDVQLMLTPDGRYAICIGGADWLNDRTRSSTNNSASESVITVVDLQNFAIQQTRWTRDLGLSEGRGYRLTSGGLIYVNGVERAPKSNMILVSLDLPSLQAGSRCDYDRPTSKPMEEAGPIPVICENCAQALNHSSLEQVVQRVPPVPLSGFTCGQVPEKLCPQPDFLTADRRFGIGIRAEGHDSMLGHWVWRPRTVVAFSASTRSEIGEINLNHTDVELRLTSLGGRDYLLILWPGSELIVYELREDESVSTKSR